MKVKILRLKDNTLIDARILDSKYASVKLPSVVDGWRFNFSKHSKRKGFETYILVKEDNPSEIEGCLIFEMKKEIEPYMSFI